MNSEPHESEAIAAGDIGWRQFAARPTLPEVSAGWSDQRAKCGRLTGSRTAAGSLRS